MITKNKKFMRYVRRTLRMLNDHDSSTDECLDCSREVMEWILEYAKGHGR